MGLVKHDFYGRQGMRPFYKRSGDESDNWYLDDQYTEIADPKMIGVEPCGCGLFLFWGAVEALITWLSH